MAGVIELHTLIEAQSQLAVCLQGDDCVLDHGNAPDKMRSNLLVDSNDAASSGVSGVLC